MLRKSRRRRDDGAAAVEFALVGGLILIPLVMGILAFGLYFWSTTQVNHALREGARAGATGMSCNDWNALMRQRLAGVNWTRAEMEPRVARLAADPFTITVTWSQPIVPVPGGVGPSANPTLQASTRVERMPDDTSACMVTR